MFPARRKTLITAATLGICIMGLDRPRTRSESTDAKPYTKAPAPIAAVYNWTGFYIGAQVRYAWGDNRTTEFVNATGLPTGFTRGFNTDGFVGGGHIGYNWQAGQFVFGLEGDIEGADISGGYRLANLNGTDFRLDTQASIRGRLGIAFNNSLLYVTGGGAWADMDHTYVFANTLFERVSQNRTGYTVGAGWEYGFTPAGRLVSNIATPISVRSATLPPSRSPDSLTSIIRCSTRCAAV